MAEDHEHAFHYQNKIDSAEGSVLVESTSISLSGRYVGCTQGLSPSRYIRSILIFVLKSASMPSCSIQKEATARREEHFIQQNRKNNQTEKVKEEAVRLLDVEDLYGKHRQRRTIRRPSKQQNMIARMQQRTHSVVRRELNKTHHPLLSSINLIIKPIQTRSIHKVEQCVVEQLQAENYDRLCSVCNPHRLHDVIVRYTGSQIRSLVVVDKGKRVRILGRGEP